MSRKQFLVVLLLMSTLLVWIPARALSQEDPGTGEPPEDPAAVVETEEPAEPAPEEDPAAAVSTEDPGVPAVDDPAADLPSEEGTTDPDTGVTKYTAEEFESLSDDAKKDVYLNSPQQLPDGFSPEPYMDILYPAQESST